MAILRCATDTVTFFTGVARVGLADALSVLTCVVLGAELAVVTWSPRVRLPFLPIYSHITDLCQRKGVPSISSIDIS